MKMYLKDTAVIAAGYVILGAGFGILMMAHGYPLLYTFLMATCIYAGSMQYVGLALFMAKASYTTVFFTTILVNLRHLFYGLAMLETYTPIFSKNFYSIFALTDETFSLLMNHKDKDNTYRFWVSFLNQLYWVMGCVLGHVCGQYFPFKTQGISFVMTAFFVTIFVEQWLSTKDHFAAILGFVITLLSLMVFGKSNFLLFAMVMIIVVLYGKRRVETWPKK